MADKVALVTGVTGQDGAYLAEFLLKKGYVVHGVKRRSSSLNTARVDHLYQDPHFADTNFFLHYGDMTDATNLIRLMQETQPTEIYNLAAQSHVQVSFETPEYTANADALGTLRLAGGDPHPASLSRACASIRPRPRNCTAIPASAADRDDAVLAAQSLRRGQALCLLDHGELPRGLRHSRLQRHPVQS